MRVKEAGRIDLRSIYVFFCLLFIFVISGCGSSGSPSDPDVDLNHLHFSVKLINEATGSETDAISEGNPGVLQITVTYDNDKNKPAPGKLVTATPTKGSFSVSADGTDSTDANGVAEIKLVPVNADGESVTGAGEISVQSGEYVIETPFAFQIGVPDSTRLGAFIDGSFQGGVLSSSLVSGETLSYGGTALIVADLVDGDGNPFDQPVTVEFTSQCGATLTASVLTENGRAVCVYTSNGCSSAQDVVTATVLKGGTDLTAMVAIPLAEEATGSIEFVSVQPSNIAVAGTATAAKPENALVTFKVKDDKGHAMARELIFFSLTTTTGGITVSPLSRETDENGEVTALVKSGTVATSVRVKAISKGTSISTLSGNISIEETPLSESIGSISLSSGSIIIPADGQSQVTVRATVLDKSGLPMPAVDVNFSTTLGTLSAGTAWTRSDGIAEVQLGSTSSGTAVITANAHGFLTNLSINFTPGASMNLSLQPAVTNDGTIQAGESIDFNATLRDSRGNPVSNQQINFTFPDNGNTSGASLSVTTATTNSSGIALVNYTAGADPGVDVLKATLNSNQSISNTARMAVIQKTVTVGSMTINADPEVIKADGASSSAITVNIKDTSGAPVPAGTEVDFSTTLGLFSNGGTTLTVETTDDTGSLTVSLISALITGDAKVSAVAGGVSQSVTVTFAITIEPVVGTIALAADPAVISADGAGSSTITALINDTTGTPIPQGQSVVFTTTLGTFADGSTRYELNTADDTGRIITSLNAGTVPGFAVVTASAGGISQSVVVTLASLDASAVGNILIDADPTVIPANGGSSSTLNITINDTAGNPVASGHPVYVSTDLGTFSNGGRSIELATTDDSGKLVTSLNAGDTPGFALVAVTSGGISQSVVVTISDINAPAVGSVSLSVSPAAIPADGASSAILTAVALDVTGAPVPQGTLIRFATDTLGILDPENLDGDGNARTLVLETVDDTGTLSVSLIAGNTAGFTRVTATVGGVSQVVVVTLTDIGAPDVGSVALSADPTTLPADGASSTTITATALDVGGNPVPQGTLFYFSTDLGTFFPDNRDQDNDPQTQTLATIDDSGTLIVSLIAGTTSGDAHVTALVGGVSQLLNISIGNGAVVGAITLSATPTAIPADGASSSAVTARISDTSGNLMPKGTSVIFTTSLGAFSNGGTTQTIETTDDSGSVTVSLIASSADGFAEVTATSGGVTQRIIVTFEAADAPAVVGAITLSATPTAIPADGASSSAVTARISDTSGNLMPKGTSVIFTTSLGAFSNGGTTQTIETTDDSGSVTVSLIASSADGFAEVTATSGGVTQRIIVTFEAADAPAVVGAITLSATPTAIPADGASSSAVTARISDTSGNLMPKGTSVIFTTSLGAFSNGGTTQTIETTDDSGSVTVSLIASSADGFAEVTATSGGVTQRIIVTFEAADAPAVVGAITLSATPTAIPADGASSSAVTARISDTSGNLMPKGTSVIFTTSLGAFSNGGTTQTIETTDDSGSVTVSLIASSADGFAEVTATSGGVTQRIIVTFEAADAPAVVGAITLSATPTAIPADGASSSAVTARISDTSGNLMPKGTSVIFTTSLGAFSNGGTTQTIETTDDSGSVTVSLIASSADGFAEVTATSGGVTQAVVVAFTDIGAPDVGSVSLGADPTAIPADGVSSTTVTAVALDVGGTPVPQGTQFLFSTDIGTFSNGTTSLELETVDNTGTLSVSLIAGNAVDFARVTAVVGGVSQQVIVTFTGVSDPVMGTVLLSADPDEIPADGLSSTAITATIRDITGSPIPAGILVRFETTLGTFTDDGDGESRILTVETQDDSGVVEVSLISEELVNSAAATVHVTVGGVTQKVLVTFASASGDVVMGTISLTADPVSIPADGVTSTSITATVNDISGAAVPKGTLITFQTNRGTFLDGGEMSLTVATTDDSGVVRISLIAAEPDNPGIANIDVESGGVTQRIDVTFEGSVIRDPAFLSLSTSTTSIKTDGTDFATITARVLDDDRVPIEGTTVYFSTQGRLGNGGQISIASARTDENGDATVDLSSGSDKTNDLVTITATVSGLVPVNIPVQMIGSSIVLNIGTTSLQIGDSTNLTVSVTDGGGQPVYDALVTTGLEPVGYVSLDPSSDGRTDVNGNLEIEVTGDAAYAGSVILTVSALGDTKTLNLTVTGDPFGIEEFGDSTSKPTGDHFTLTVNSPGGNDVNFFTSMGYWDNQPGSTSISVTPVSTPDGYKATAEFYTGNTAGVATIRVEDANNPDAVDTLYVAISAEADEATQISLQVAPSVIPPSTGEVSNIATLSATVRNASGQVVYDAPVLFSFFRTTGGGETINPPIVYTDGQGQAQSTFTSGSLVSDSRGVLCLVRIAGAVVAGPDNGFTFNGITITRSDGGSFIDDGFADTNIITIDGSDFNDGEYSVAPGGVAASVITVSGASFVSEGPGASLVIRKTGDTADSTGTETDLVSVVISGQASSISIGGATVVEVLNPSTYNYPMSVLLADSNGNPVDGVTVNLSVWPTMYYTGLTVANVGPVRTYGYLNEDINQNQILDPTEDTNGHPAGADFTKSNGQLDPGKSTAGTVPATVTTDENGVAQFDYIYQKNYAGWLDVEIRATALVYGSETSSSIEFGLGFLVSEASNIPHSPWGPGPVEDPTPATISITPSQTSIPADGVSSTSITVSVADTSGSAMPQGTKIRLQTNAGAFSNGATEVIVTTPDGSGMVTVSLIAADEPGFAEITATVVDLTTLTQQTIITFSVPGVPFVGSISLAAATDPVTNPTSIPGDGASSATIKATITDILANPVPEGTLVRFNTDLGTFQNDGDGRPRLLTVETPDATGVVEISLIAPTFGPGTATVIVTSGGITQLVTINITL